ncbi:MAG: sbcD [Hyphomicrobiales bacterium]|nr:sbcD [Hyphomicrobiales bacterium]
MLTRFNGGSGTPITTINEVKKAGIHELVFCRVRHQQRALSNLYRVEFDAAEIGYNHGVTLVELGPAGPRSEHIRIARTVPCVRLPETGSLTLSELPGAIAALELDPVCEKDKRPFVYAVLNPDGPAAGLSGEVQRVLEEHPLRCAGVKIERPARADSQIASEPSRSLAECDPAELFEKAFAAAHGEAPGAQHRLAFESIRTGE